ncbi:hypothetical protein [Microbacterium sp. A93]|uniref:antitoxin VbhA family protein n=1 Tax=Microbacterium sp. A93 TaxID=3450716 RepID=UPI003F430838
MTLAEVRKRQVDEALHSAELAGLSASEETRADADSFASGQIDSDELVDRVRARNGLS